MFDILNVGICILNLEVPTVDGRKNLKWIFKKSDGEVWIGLIWLRIGALEMVLSVCTCWFHSMAT
jgi:hypothetical protein